MSTDQLRIVVCGLSITSSWGNGHATTYRGLIRELCKKGHEVLFLECDQPWYAENRDLPRPPYGKTLLYSTVEEFKDRFTRDISTADAVIVGSYVPQGVEIGRWIIANVKDIAVFYDIDTPITLRTLNEGRSQYLSKELIPQYHLYLSFTGGATLRSLQDKYGSPRARALYCSVDTEDYYPEQSELKWDLGYLGTFSQDRQPSLEKLLLHPAEQKTEGKFVVAGSQYPEGIYWSENVDRIIHLPPDQHRSFYNSQRFTLNITRKDMIEAGFSPSIRLFEAAACGTPIISDSWIGLDSFFEIDTEILIVQNSDQVLNLLTSMSEDERREIGQRGRAKILSKHTSAHRAGELEIHIQETLEERAKVRKTSRSASWTSVNR